MRMRLWIGGLSGLALLAAPALADDYGVSFHYSWAPANGACGGPPVPYTAYYPSYTGDYGYYGNYVAPRYGYSYYAGPRYGYSYSYSNYGHHSYGRRTYVYHSYRRSGYPYSYSYRHGRVHYGRYGGYVYYRR